MGWAILARFRSVLSESKIVPIDFRTRLISSECDPGPMNAG
ncbi:unnamed protein product [marine sediment metagenome]|uniref:Uncharacterized protein n=1 Tax=marine sediment metagenome TaxID=412755 RepID=X0RTS0_9ZZZZ